MAKLKSMVIRFAPSDSPDVVSNLLYVDDPGSLTYDSPSWDVGNVVDPDDGTVHVDLGAVLGDYDGVYDIGIAAIDDGGNEADMSMAQNIPLDFVAPNPVGALVLP